MTVLHDDARTVRLPARPDGVFTSPPYPGLIDYHEQHRYAYELLGLVDRRDGGDRRGRCRTRARRGRGLRRGDERGVREHARASSRRAAGC